MTSLPAGMSIVPGEPRPTRAMAAGSRPACRAASSTALPIRRGGVFRPLLRLRGDAQPGQRAAKVIDHADLDVGSPQIDAREKRRLGLAG